MKNTTEAARVIPFKRKRNHKKMAAIIGLGILVAFVALFTPWFNIKSIIVEGSFQIKQEDIINASGIPIGQNIFRVNYFRAKSAIKQNPYIEKVSISRKYPNKITIKVVERKRAGYIAFKGNNIIIDKNGFVLEVVKMLMELTLL
jgi:cell division protein FtsQ